MIASAHHKQIGGTVILLGFRAKRSLSPLAHQDDQMHAVLMICKRTATR